MFLKINICEDDRDAQHLLWRNNDKSIEPREYVMSSMLFGAKSSPSTALYIKNKNAALFLSNFTETVNSIIDNCYINDFLDSCETSTEASKRVREAIKINKNTNWEMHGWSSNCASVLNKISNSNSSSNLVKIDGIDNSGKVLGLRWFNQPDELAFNLNNNKITRDLSEGLRKPTKIEFLGIIMCIFDPLGLLSPFTIQARILMQEIWSSKINWDEVLLDLEFSRWKQWLKEIKRVNACPC